VPGGRLMVVDTAGRVSWASAAAQAMLDEGSALRLNGYRLATREPADQRRLDNLIAAANRGTPGELILCDEEGEGVLASADWRAGAVWLKISNLRPVNGTAERFAALFDLTRAEARLAEALLSGLDPSDCADRFGVARTTIRSQLDSLFDKTGRRRQGALLVLLAAVAAA
jgi:DNA-binding CsgD family transcriptional regulator